LAGKCAESFRFGISELAARRVEMVKNSNFAATKIKPPEYVRAAYRKTFRYPPGPGEPGRPSAASSLAIPEGPPFPPFPPFPETLRYVVTSGVAGQYVAAWRVARQRGMMWSSALRE
jgi:hypothetical protein